MSATTGIAYVKPEDKKGTKGFSSFFKSKAASPVLVPPGYDGTKAEKRLTTFIAAETKGPLAAVIKSPSIEASAANNGYARSFSLGRGLAKTTDVSQPVSDISLSLLEPAPQKQNHGFPILFTLPSGEKVVFTGTTDMTVLHLIQSLSEQVQELSNVPLSDIQILDPSVTAYLPADSALLPHVSAYVAASTIPRLNIVISPHHRKDSPKILNNDFVSTSETSQEFAAKTFKIQLQLPGGQTLYLQCKGNDTIEDVKTQIVPLSLMAHGIDLLAQMDKYTLTVPGVESSTGQCDSSMSFIEACRKKSVIPKLVLLEKPSAFTKKEKLTNKMIGSLIDKPLCWTVEELEKTTFHQKTTRLQYLRKKNRGSDYGVHVNPTAVNPLPPGTKVFFNINLPLNEVIKTIVGEDNESADTFISRIFHKYYAKKLPDKSPSDFVLKAKGIAEYIYGEHPLHKYDYVRSNLSTSKKIELTMVERQSAFDAKSDDAEECSAQEFFEVEDAGIRYSHDEIQTSAHSWDHLTCMSIWELKREFRVRLICVENLRTVDSVASTQQSQLYVTAALFHGGEQQSRAASTQLVDSCSNPRWHEWLNLNMAMYNIPRATRVCFTLYERRVCEQDMPVAWVNHQLFDYKHELKTGIQELGMWIDHTASANPIGTCVSNSAPGAPILYVELEQYPLPIVFPTEPHSKAYSPAGSSVPRNQNSIDHVNRIVTKDPLFFLNTNDKEILWAYRDFYKFDPKGLPKFLSSVPYNDMLAVQEMHKYLKLWAPIAPQDALELLDARFEDVRVRQHAVSFLEKLSDEEVLDCLLQLIQVLKYEAYHDCALSRMLLNRALNNVRIGHSFFWYLKSEMHVREISERYGLLLEAYLRGCGPHMTELQKQNEVMKNLVRVANIIKPIKDCERRDVLLAELDKVKFPQKFQLPLNPRIEVSGLLLNKCKYMDSKKLPLWLVFSNADPTAPPVYVIFKSGDDLRQDMLTLQMIQLMDKFWKQEGLDLRMSPYGCISSGDGVGMIEVVLNADTTAHIQKMAGGTIGAFRSDPLANWLKHHNPTEEGFRAAVENFIKSCAGYCVATYVLGIGDRHNDNVMLTKTGKLFHIDFGHFLGNYKKKFGVKRERAPFVFTPDFAFVMGGKDTPDFNQFINLCCTAYNIVRKHAAVFINLFAMMLSTGIPELTCVEDITYLREAFSLEDRKSVV